MLIFTASATSFYPKNRTDYGFLGVNIVLYICCFNKQHNKNQIIEEQHFYKGDI